MRKTRIVLLMACASLAGIVLLGRAGAQTAAPAANLASAKVAVCDIVEVFGRYERAKALVAEFEKRGQKLNAEQQDRSKKIRDAKAILEGYDKDSEAMIDQLAKVQQLTADLKVWQETLEARLQRERSVLTKDMYHAILQAIGELAKESGVQIVLYRRQGELSGQTLPDLLDQIERRQLLYAAGELDITNAVVARLNASYQPGKK